MLGNPVLVLHTDEDVSKLKIEYLTDDTLPEELNGESGFHIYHVRMLTELLLRELALRKQTNLTEDDIVAISIASSLHDIGKRRIPKSILDFPGKLSPVEYDIVKKHCVFGEELLDGLCTDDVAPDILKYAKEITRSHHERYDGTGYPDGLKGDAIPLCAQVVALADAYDALTSSRSYKRAFSQDVAIQTIFSGMCGVFEETLLDCLLKVVNHHTLVTLRQALDLRRSVLADQTSFTPERVLCVGNTGYLNKEFLDATFPDSKVTVLGDSDLIGADRLKLFRIRTPSIRAVFETYEFDVIIFFSGALSYRTTEKSDAEELREVLKFTAELQRDAKVLYLSSLDCAMGQSDRSILALSKEHLCEFYAHKFALDVKIIQIPYLYSGTYEKDFLFHIFEQSHRLQPLQLDEVPSNALHFISLSDLSELIVRILENWSPGSGILVVGDTFQQTFSDLERKLTSLGGTPFDYTGQPSQSLLHVDNRALRNEYGWFAKTSILEDLPEQYHRYKTGLNEKALPFGARIRNWIHLHSRIAKALELLLLFLLTELLLLLTDSAVIFSIVDFRMAFIVIMATVHGLSYGLAAAGLSSLSWLIAKVGHGTDLLTIFYEPNNWLAFVFFFLVGALCGYVKLRKDDHIRFVREQNTLLEDKLVFTRELYEDTFQEKRDLKKQIIGSKDSFGKIFDITRKLDTVESHSLYLRIIETFEDVLENKNVTVYSVNNESTFGRLEVASRDIIDTVSRSISTKTYAPILETISGGEIWRNTELLPEFPMYAAGVFRGDQLVLLIFLWNVDVDQRSLYYVNLFKILRDLAQMSLLRAYDYNQAVYNRQYMEGTNIMNPQAFDACLGNFVHLAEKKVSSFVLLSAQLKGRSYSEASTLLKGKVRANDILGATEDGNLRILLSQATEKDLDFILPRFDGLDMDITILR